MGGTLSTLKLYLQIILAITLFGSEVYSGESDPRLGNRGTFTQGAFKYEYEWIGAYNHYVVKAIPANRGQLVPAPYTTSSITLQATVTDGSAHKVEVPTANTKPGNWAYSNYKRELTVLGKTGFFRSNGDKYQYEWDGALETYQLQRVPERNERPGSSQNMGPSQLLENVETGTEHKVENRFDPQTLKTGNTIYQQQEWEFASLGKRGKYEANGKWWNYVWSGANEEFRISPVPGRNEKEAPSTPVSPAQLVSLIKKKASQHFPENLTGYPEERDLLGNAGSFRGEKFDFVYEWVPGKNVYEVRAVQERFGQILPEPQGMSPLVLYGKVEGATEHKVMQADGEDKTFKKD